MCYEAKWKLACVKMDFKGKIIVAGDIHGDFRAFERIREVFNSEPESLLIFLGDYADRGDQGLEVVEGVQELMREYEGRVIPLKGNHEDYRDGIPFTSPCDLPAEVEAKKHVRWEDFYPRLESEFFSRLFLAALIPRVALCVHGGVSSRLHPENLENPPRSLEEEIFWSDPWEGDAELPGSRGPGVLFGLGVCEQVLKRFGVKFLIRSHEPHKAVGGPVAEHGGRTITVSTTSLYGGRPFVLVFTPNPGLTPEEILRSARYL